MYIYWCAKNIFWGAGTFISQGDVTYQHCTLQPYWQAKRAYFVVSRDDFFTLTDGALTHTIVFYIIITDFTFRNHVKLRV